MGMEHRQRFLIVQKLVIVFLHKLVIVTQRLVSIVVVVLIICTAECHAELGLRVFVHLIFPVLVVHKVNLKCIRLEIDVQQTFSVKLL